jgi:hypothetical protein
MADTGSMLKSTRKTSPGEPAVGTTFIDETSQGSMPGEIPEMETPHTILFHERNRDGSAVIGESLNRHEAILRTERFASQVPIS